MSWQTAAVILIVTACIAAAAVHALRIFRRGDGPCYGCRQCEKAVKGKKQYPANPKSCSGR